jgi:hypothetical protein
VDFPGKAQHSLAALLQIIVTAFMPVCRTFRSKMGPQHSFPLHGVVQGQSHPPSAALCCAARSGRAEVDGLGSKMGARMRGRDRRWLLLDDVHFAKPESF